MIKKERPEIHDNIPETYKSLIISCWKHDPDDRPSFKWIVNDLNFLESTLSTLNMGIIMKLKTHFKLIQLNKHLKIMNKDYHFFILSFDGFCGLII